jgi:iron complex outermembrane receptor protein
MNEYIALRPRARSGTSVSIDLIRAFVAASAVTAILLGSPSASLAADASDQLEEIVVTAEKRSETVQTTPISITAITGDQLAAQGLASVEDVAGYIPGISMRSAGPGQTEFEMRGLASSGGAAPTVGFYLDETPLSAPAASLNGRVVIDPDLFDLSRVEVLRGPQGTLYGSGSMGGTIRLITNQPKLGEYEAAVRGTFSDTDGGGFNPGGSGMINLPIGNVMALRVVVTEKYTDGFIDRVVLSPFPFPTNPGTCLNWFGYGCTRGNVAAAPVQQVIKDTNTNQLTSGRASLLIQPSDALSLTTAVMYQRMLAGGYNQFQSPPGSSACLCIYQPYNLKEPISDTFKLASETIAYTFDFAQLTSATSYFSREEDQSQDSTEALQNLDVLPAFLPAVFTEKDKSRQFNQELRLASPGQGPLQWVGGAFFEDLHSPYQAINQSPAYAPFSFGGAAANPMGEIYDASNDYHIKQDALFADISYQFNSDFKFITGVRWYKYETDTAYSEAGLDAASGNAQAITGSIEQSARGYNPKFTLSYTPDGDLTVYSTISKGFRPGGVTLPVPTTGAVICPAESPTYRPDSVWNYEIGEKAKMLDNRFVINSDLYYIRWDQIQQNITLPCGYTYTTNAGNAESYGPEIELIARLTSELSVSANGAITHATIVDANPSTGIQDGTRVLNIPKSTASLVLTYDRHVTETLDSVTRIMDSFVGNTADIAFYPTTLPSYDLVNLGTGLTTPKWSANLFADNVINKHAELTSNNASFSWNTPAVTRITTNMPRTIGVDLQYKF